MSCCHPLLGRPTGNLTVNGKKEYKIIPQYCGELEPGDVPIPCGKCIGCRLDYSRAWADRMMLELDHSKKAIFLTVTYDNDHVPFIEDEETGEVKGLTLYKKDHQDFMKRLRRAFPERKLKFYVGAEYGTNTHRPHMHYIIFGLSLDDFPDKRLLGKNELGQQHFDSPFLRSKWENGFVVLAAVNWKTCAYVSRYVQKKVFHGYDYLIRKLGLEEEFSCMSRRPGIASDYLTDNPSAINTSKWYVAGYENGIRPSRYFREKMSLLSPETYDNIKKERIQFARDRDFLKFLKTDLSLVEQYEVEENKKLEQTSILHRRV